MTVFNRIARFVHFFSLSLIFLLWGCVATAQVPRDSGPRHTYRGQTCDDYARIAVSQDEQNLRRQCGFTGSRWTSDYNAHYQWCTTVSRESADSEIRAREDELRQCRDRRSACDDYARIAVSQSKQNLKRQCGFTGSRWSSDYDAHYQWCGTVSRESADSEIRAREDELRQCKDRRSGCDDYARTAVSQNEQNLRRRCGFTGSRWSSDYNAHYQWCSTVPWESADLEIRAREDELRRCR
jgi:hypothetical protein